MYHNVQSLHKEMPKTTKCTVKSVKLMIMYRHGMVAEQQSLKLQREAASFTRTRLR